MNEEQSIPSAEDVVFGDVQTKQHAQNQSPPSSNGHFAVQSIPPNLARSGTGPSTGSTAAATSVFVDLDVMLDMQEHAAEDTSVELGGILLGYRGVMDDGVPYVVINDALRARHYKATRGSFTFTHETWADLNARRASLPESTEIVGWYHTHPGWGVFLSDMDVFICDHFFSQPDDVALVIDPTSGDTGLFVRRGSPANRSPQRLASYQIYAHRKCRDALTQWANYFSGGKFMSSPNAVFPGRSSAPVIVSTSANDGAANRILILLGAGLIGSQMFLALVFLMSQQAPVTAPTVAGDIQVREAVVDQLLSKIEIDGREGISQSYREVALQNVELQSANLGLLSRIQSLEANLQQAATQNQKLGLELEAVRKRLTESKQLAAGKIEAGEQTVQAESVWWKSTWMVAAGSVLLGAIISGFGVFYSLRNGLLNSR